jgi:hypothetical protein
MKDLVQCRKLEAKFRQLAVSDPARRFLWLAEAEKWEREAEAEIASHFEARNAVRTTVAIEPITTNLVHAPEGGALIASGFTARVGRAGGARTTGLVSSGRTLVECRRVALGNH